MPFQSGIDSFKDGYHSLPSISELNSWYGSQGLTEPPYVKVISSIVGLGIITWISYLLYPFKGSGKTDKGRVSGNMEETGDESHWEVPIHYERSKNEENKNETGSSQRKSFEDKDIDLYFEVFDVESHPKVNQQFINTFEDVLDNYRLRYEDSSKLFKLKKISKNEWKFKYVNEDSKRDYVSMLEHIEGIEDNLRRKLIIQGIWDRCQFIDKIFNEIKSDLNSKIDKDRMRDDQDEESDIDEHEIVNETIEYKGSVSFYMDENDINEKGSITIDNVSEDDISMMNDLMKGYDEIIDGKENDSLTLLRGRENNAELLQYSDSLRKFNVKLLKLKKVSVNNLKLIYLGNKSNDQDIVTTNTHLGLLNGVLMTLNTKGEDSKCYELFNKIVKNLKNIQIKLIQQEKEEILVDTDSAIRVHSNDEKLKDHEYDIKIDFTDLRDDTIDIMRMVIKRYKYLLLNYEPEPLNYYWNEDGNFRENIDKDLPSEIEDRNKKIRFKNTDIIRLKDKQELLFLDDSTDNHTCLLFRYPGLRSLNESILNHFVGFEEIFRLLNDEKVNGQDQAKIIGALSSLSSIVYNAYYEIQDPLESQDSSKLEDSSNSPEVEASASLDQIKESLMSPVKKPKDLSGFEFESGKLNPGFVILKHPFFVNRYKLKPVTHQPTVSIVHEESMSTSMDFAGLIDE